MTYLKKLLIVATLVLTTAGLTSFSTKAALITHDIIGTDVTDGLDKLIGNITINTNDVDSFGEVTSFVDFNIRGVPLTIDPLGDFYAGFDVNDIFTGIQYFGFDLTWDGVGFSFSGAYDIAAGDPISENTLDIFSPSNSIFAFYENVSLSEATVVPEPPMIALLLMIAGAAYMRRRKA